MATNRKPRQQCPFKSNRVLLQILNPLGTVIEKLDKISILLENKKHEEVIKTEFEETRQTIQRGFQLSPRTLFLQITFYCKDKEILKARIKSWKVNLNQRKRSYWSYLRTENLVKKYQEPALIPKKYTPIPIQGELDIMKLRIENLISKCHG